VDLGLWKRHESSNVSRPFWRSDSTGWETLENLEIEEINLYFNLNKSFINHKLKIQYIKKKIEK
jgi:hypothetical protein